MTCLYCNHRLGPDAGPYQVAHVECSDEWNRRRDAGMCVACGSADTPKGCYICAACGRADPVPYSGYPTGVCR